MTRVHPFDFIAASLTCRQKLFSRGWGDEMLLRHFAQHGSFAQPLAPICIDWSVTGREDGKIQRDGTFTSPLDLLPEQTRTGHIRGWERKGTPAAVVILAASRDEGYKTRESVFRSLVSRGLDLYLLENPFYGLR